MNEENENRKERHLECLRSEIVQWKKLLNDSNETIGSSTSSGGNGSSSTGNDTIQNIFKDYEKILTGEQLQYIRSAVDYKKWLAESNEFRKHIAYYTSKRKYNNMLCTDYEENALNRIEAVATSDYVDNFVLNHYPL